MSGRILLPLPLPVTVTVPLRGIRRQQSTSCRLRLADRHCVSKNHEAMGRRGTTSSASPSLSDSYRHSAKPARVAVVGSGRMGHIRTQLIHANPKLQLVGIVDSNLSTGRALAQTYHVPAFESLLQLMDEQEGEADIQAVVCCSPTFSHRSIVEQVINLRSTAGGSGISHVFLEKPVEESAPKIEALFDFASQHNLELCCGFQRRFDPSYQSALNQLPTIVNNKNNYTKNRYFLNN